MLSGCGQRRPGATAHGGQHQKGPFSRLAHQATLALLAAAALLISSLPASAAGVPTGPQSRTGAHVDARLRQWAVTEPGATLPVLINRQNTSAVVGAVQTHGGSVKRDLLVGNTVAAEVPASSLEALAQEPGVVRITYDAPVKLQAAAGPALNAANLQTVYPLAVGATDLWTATPPVQGTNVAVAVLDSGIQEIPDFTSVGPSSTCGPGATRCGSRIIQKVPIALSTAGGPDDDNGHGTWVAGIIGGRQPTQGGRYVGVAPDVSLIGIKVSDKDGVARTSDVIGGIEWAVKNKDIYNIRVLNLSLVSGVAESYKTSLLDAAVELAWLKGLVVVVAAGNGGPDTMRYPPANDPYVLAVGATDDHGTAATSDDGLAWFSSYGLTQDGFAKPDLVAPGRHIASTLAAPNIPLAQLFPTKIVERAYISLSGTSAAAPVVSGVVSQLLQARPGLTPDQVQWLLRQTALAVPGTGTGAGYPQATAAVRFTGVVDTGKRGLIPNIYLTQAYEALHGGGNVSWDNVSWDNVSWDNVSWDNVSWDNVSWDNVSWDNVLGD
jgi:serine protease AprX